MALFHLVAHSASVLGAGVVGGSPYGCNVLYDSGNTCSGWRSDKHAENTSIPWADAYLPICRRYLLERERDLLVDPLASLQRRPVYLLSGHGDMTVYQSVMRAVARQFDSLGAAVETQFGLDNNHAWLVDNSTCRNRGVALNDTSRCCGLKGVVSCPAPPHAASAPPGGCCGGCGNLPGWRPPINNCDYDMSGAMFRWLLGPYGGTVRPHGAANAANLLQFDQAPHVPANWTLASSLLDAVGFVYAPRQCRGAAVRGGGGGGGGGGGNCRLHVHYHPCGGSWHATSTNYMLESGLAGYAETNGYVILHPQTVGPAKQGCWDWYGATDALFDTRRVRKCPALPLLFARRQTVAQEHFRVPAPGARGPGTAQARAARGNHFLRPRQNAWR